MANKSTNKHKFRIKFTLKMPKKFDVPLHFATLVLIAFGTLMIVSTNVGQTAADPLLLVKVLIKQVMYIVISYLLFIMIANNFTISNAYKLHKLMAVGIFVALLSTQLFDDVLGSKAWIHFPLFNDMEITIQPAEFAKVFMVATMAIYFEKFKSKKLFWSIARIPTICFCAFLIAILLQQDLGTALVFTMLSAFCFIIPSHPSFVSKQRLLKIAMSFVMVIGILLMSKPGIAFVQKIPFLKDHVAVRFEIASNPFLYPEGKGYQLINGLYGISRSDVTGQGLGNSVQKYGYLTQSDNDFILAIIVEELGIFGLGIVVIGYILILQRLFFYAFKTSSGGNKIILMGTGLYLFIHFVLNVGGISGLIPLTGVPLLFISSGGSSLMAIMCSIGLSQACISNIRRTEFTKKEKVEAKIESSTH